MPYRRLSTTDIQADIQAGTGRARTALARYGAPVRGPDPAQMPPTDLDTPPFATSTLTGAATVAQPTADTASIDGIPSGAVLAGIKAHHAEDQTACPPCP